MNSTEDKLNTFNPGSTTEEHEDVELGIITLPSSQDIASQLSECCDECDIPDDCRDCDCAECSDCIGCVG